MTRARGHALAVAGHLLVVSAPLVVIGEWSGMAVPRVGILLALAAFWHVLESETARVVGAPAPAAMRDNYGAAATGMGVLVTLWVCILDAVHREVALGIGAVLGSLVIIGGVVLRVAAIRRLGSHFSSDDGTPPGSRLITDGVYALVRHPSELGTICVVGGAAMLCASGWGAGVASLVVLVVVWRTRREDRRWRCYDAVGFARYEARVGGLIPILRTRYG